MVENIGHIGLVLFAVGCIFLSRLEYKKGTVFSRKKKKPEYKKFDQAVIFIGAILVIAGCILLLVEFFN